MQLRVSERCGETVVLMSSTRDSLREASPFPLLTTSLLLFLISICYLFLPLYSYNPLYKSRLIYFLHPFVLPMADHVQDPADPSKSAKPMTSQQLIIEYSKPGISSPVFVAGTFTSWEPIQMETKQASDSAASKDEELHFIYIFKNVTEGEHQYKFRLGPGDWWATDERVKTGGAHS